LARGFRLWRLSDGLNRQFRLCRKPMLLVTPLGLPVFEPKEIGRIADVIVGLSLLCHVSI
jgi:hypothetical protein